MTAFDTPHAVVSGHTQAGPARRTLARAAAAAALILIVFAAREMVGEYRYTKPLEQGFDLAIAGALLLLLALWLSRPPRAEIRVFSGEGVPADGWRESPGRRRLKRVAVVVAAAGMLVLIEVNTGLIGIAPLQAMSHHIQFAILAACCILPVWSLSDRPLRLPRWRDLSRAQRLALAFLAAATLGALALRLWNLEILRAYVDEGNFLLPMRRFAFETDVPLMQPMASVAAFPLIYPYLQSVAASFASSALIGMRVPAALFGSLTVPALYFLGTQLFDRRVAAVAALLLATQPVHVHWSRLGMNNAADLLLGVLMFALLVRGVRRGGSWHFAAAGVCLGLIQYFYEAGRLVFAALTLVWFFYFMVPNTWRTLSRRFIAIFLLTAFMIGMPVYATLAAMQRPATARLEQTSLDPDATRNGDLVFIVERFTRVVQGTMLLFVSRPEIVIYYAGGHPYFEVYLVPALVLGIAAAAWRWRTPGGSLLLLWAFGTCAAVALLINGSASSRFLIVFPPLMLICALGLVDTLRLLWGRWDRAAVISLAVIVLAFSVLHVAYYFGIHVHQVTRQQTLDQPEQEVVFHARALPPGTNIYFISRARAGTGGHLDLLLKGLNTEQTALSPTLEQLDAGYIQSLPFGTNIVYYVMTRDKATLWALNKRFVLSAPIRWPQPYLAPRIEFVAFRPLAERLLGPRALVRPFN